MIFKTVEAYVEALRLDPGLTMIPLGLVAELKGVSRSSVSEQIKSGSLEGIIFKGRRKTWRGVRPEALFAQEQRATEEAAERRAKLAAALETTAAARRTATYAEIMEPVGMAAKNPRQRAEIGVLLSEASKLSYAQHGFLMGALAVQKASGLPNGLFFQLARELGALAADGDEAAFWTAECDKVFAHYAPPVAEAAPAVATAAPEAAAAAPVSAPPAKAQGKGKPAAHKAAPAKKAAE